MLKEIEDLLRERGPTATRDLAIHFDSSPDAVDGMLKLLERKGHIKKVQMECGQGCSGCSCDSASSDLAACIWMVSQ